MIFYIFFICLIIIICIIYYLNTLHTPNIITKINNIKKKHNLSYILKTLLQKYNITYNTNNSQLYIPYSYTYVNKEFNHLKKNNLMGNFRCIFALYNCDIMEGKKLFILCLKHG